MHSLLETNDREQRAHRIADLTIDALGHENLMLRDRVADLEADNRAVRELLHMTVAALHTAHVRQRHMTEHLRGLTTVARELRQAA